MKHAARIAAVLLMMSGAAAGRAQAAAGGVDRLYILDCGQGHAADQSRWTVGVNVGKPIDISVNCYLIRHGRDWFLWDTGISDHVAEMPEGWLPGNDPKTGIHWTRAKTLLAQLAQLGLSPSDIHYVGISHTHPDHIGNIERFPDSLVYIQQAEYEGYFAAGNPGVAAPPGDTAPRFSKDHKVKLVEEDLDVFGDGSILIVYTPGHTPGHQSCLVHLPQTGWVLLSGDAVHLRSNWDNRRLPYFGRLSPEARLETAISMQRMADLMAFYHAQLWINHDIAQSRQLRHAPQFYR